MGIRTKTELSLEVGQDNNLDDCLFERSYTELLDTLDHASSQIMTIGASETDVVIPMGDVAQARIVYLEADGEFTVTLGTEIITVERPADPTGATAAEGVKAYLLATANTTSVKVTNPSATVDIKLRALIAGDLTA